MRKIFLLLSLCLFLYGHSQVSKTINVTTAGTLSTLLTSTEKSTVTNLTVTGNIDARDFRCMSYEMPALSILDIGKVTIQEYDGSGGTETVAPTKYFANQIPVGAFFLYGSYGKPSLTSITLPSSITSIKNTSFTYCNNLKTIKCLSINPPVLCDKNIFEGVNPTVIYVPAGTLTSYKTADGWSTFTTILEYILSITTKPTTAVSLSTATLNSNIDLITDSPVSSHGFCWNTTGAPTIADNKIDNGAKNTTGTFSNSISSLSSGTTYYVKAFATDGERTVYGNEVSFTTASLPSTAGTISGVQTVSQGQNAVTYTVQPINNATSYIWTLPTGASGTSTTNSITVNYSKTAISGNITVKGHNEWGDGTASSLVVSVSPLIVNCSDSLNLSANTVRPVKISFATLGYGSDDIEMAVFAEDLTTMVCRFTKHVSAACDTTLYFGAGKYYLAWLQGGANLSNPKISGASNANVWTNQYMEYPALPITVLPISINCEGKVLLNADAKYNGTGTLKYKWTPSEGLNNDSIANPTATVSSSTTYTVVATTPYGCSDTSSVDVTVGPLKVVLGSDKTVICGSTIQLNAGTNYNGYPGSGKLRYKWTPTTGLSNDTISNPTATPVNDITYTVTVMSPSGCTATDDIKLTVTPITVSAGADKAVVCGGTVQLDNVTTNYSGSGKLRYKWTPSTGLNNDTIANPTTTVFANTTYTVSVSTPGGCTSTDNILVNIIPMTKPEIGIVGVSNTNKNRVVWNKPVSTGIASYVIYKETTTSNVYEKIGSVPYDSLSVFVDNQSAPNVKSSKYKLSIIDRSGLESPQSNSHKTMHLSINKGQNNAWNLIWEPYEGFAVSTYNIYRGTSPASLNFLDATSGSSTQYSDISAPTGDVYYQLEVISTAVVNPSKSPVFIQKSKSSENSTQTVMESYSSSRSNIASNTLNGVNELEEINNKINIYPNPVKNELNIDFENGSTFEILNLMGQVIYNGNLTTNTSVSTANFTPGVYLIRFKIGNTFAYKKIIKE